MNELGQEPSTHQSLNDGRIMNCVCSFATLKGNRLAISIKGVCFLLEPHEIKLCLNFKKELEFQKFYISHKGIESI